MHDQLVYYRSDPSTSEVAALGQIMFSEIVKPTGKAAEKMPAARQEAGREFVILLHTKWV